MFYSYVEEPGPSVDCSQIPDDPTDVEELEMGLAHHDVAFDDDGNLYGSDGNGIFKITHGGNVKVFVANMSGVEGMDFLPNGDLVVANMGAGSISLVSPDGVVSNLSSENNVYGITVGPDGLIYVANHAQVFRIDPSNGNKDYLLESSDLGPGKEARVVNFSPDEDLMYISTRSAEGEVYAVELNSNLEPKDDPYLFATGVGQDWHDGLGVDECGNLYVPEYWSFGLYRISPEGDVELFHQWDGVSYGHGLEWGKGVGGWKDDHIYMPQPYDGDTVVELDIGVLSR